MPSNIVVVCCLNLFSNFHLVCLVVNRYKPKHFLAKLSVIHTCTFLQIGHTKSFVALIFLNFDGHKKVQTNFCLYNVHGISDFCSNLKQFFFSFAFPVSQGWSDPLLPFIKSC